MGVLRKVAWGATVVFAAAQLVQPSLTNPPADPARSAWGDPEIPARVRALLRRACADCHSHETSWPWYARISPMSWMLNRHVSGGREKLNFSLWGGVDPETVSTIHQETAAGRMPIPGYLLLHPGARLSADEVRLLKDWSDGKLAP